MRYKNLRILRLVSSLISAANRDVFEILEKPVTSKKKGSYIMITPEKKSKDSEICD